MSIISNIAVLQNPQAKKAFSNISFEAGETFNARIVNTDKQKGEVDLKLLDGWQFSAKLDKPLEQATNGRVLKFQVEGFEDDKLKIKLIYDDKENKATTNEGLEDFSKGKPLSIEKADALLFGKMIKHDMPLTKDNIIDIKNLIDFREKISLNSNKEETFIARYLNSRNIGHNSEKGIEIIKNLKNFFEALKNLDIDDILLFKENNIDLTKENLKSFTKLFNGQSLVYNNLKDISNYLLNSDTGKNIQDSEAGGRQNIFIDLDESNEVVTNVEFTNNNKDTKTGGLLNNNGQILDKSINLDNSIVNGNLKAAVNLINKELKNLNVDCRVLNSTIKNLEPDKNLEPNKNLIQENTSFNSIKALVDKIFKAEQISVSPDSYIKLIENLEAKFKITQVQPSGVSTENIVQNEELPLNVLQKDKGNEVDLSNKSIINNKTHVYSKNNSLNEIINMIKKELNISEVEKGIINNVENDIEKMTTDFLIKEQIKLKTEEIKNIIKDIIENKLNLKPDTYDKVMNIFNEKLNDLKMFNSVSENYYYLDLPINVKEDEYQFKLIIKDDRKKGKKIDSKNVKIVTSVKTINMGTVDAYIKINNNNMNIDINCDKFWVKVLKLGKEKLIKDLSNLNYRVSIEVNNKTKEFTLSNCGEFFDDRSFNAINIKV